ncbi:peroxisomal ATPase PEX1-like isoform X1 [Tigriopus californicus]|uniref:peroxisomal ATPase PEX1-like isoform X1 n=1 Tax=Tigriopus californicus TaxID=6832 RepID=UPI0027DA8B10|nr:peroxisomal ATPase PEX1-like isoform X1 [Tigriopus californicus]
MASPSYPVILKANNERNSFIYLPSLLMRRLDISTSQIVELSCLGVSFFGSVIELNARSIQEDEIHMSSKLIHHLGWSSTDSQIMIKPCKKPVFQIQTLFLRPCSPNDWDVIELQAEYIRDRLIEQIRIVRKGQIVLVFVGNMEVSMIAYKLEPENDLGTIGPNSLIDIEPIFHAKPIQSQVEEKVGFVRHYLNRLVNGDTEDDVNKIRRSPFVLDDSVTFRVAPKCSTLGTWFDALLVSEGVDPGTKCIARLKKVPLASAEEQAGDNYFVKCILAQSSNHMRTIFLHPKLMRSMHLKVGTRVHLQITSNETEPQVETKLVIQYHGEVEPDKSMQQRVLQHLMTASEDAKTQEKQTLADHKDNFPLLVPNGMLMSWPGPEASQNGESGHFSIFTEKHPFLARTPVDLWNRVEWKKCILKMDAIHLKNNGTVAKESLPSHLIPDAIHDYVHKCFRWFYEFSLDHVKATNVLVVGTTGIGKTSVLGFISAKLELASPQAIHCHKIDCKNDIGKSASLLIQQWRSLLEECIYRYPSVILVDDLDCLCCEIPLEEQSQRPMHLSSLASAFVDLVSTDNFRGVPVLATISNLSTLHSRLRPGKGKYLFAAIIDLPLPNKDLRGKILDHLIDNDTNIIPPTIRTELEDVTEGFTPLDVQRLWNDIAIRINKGNFDMNDIKRRIRTFRPLALANVKLEQPSPKTWADLGGLEQVRRVIHETITWPGQYPALFAQCGLRLQSGLLLYGAPGSGKTLIVGIAAKECGMNLITIKGPELLSKYIGSSEAGVRSTFERARAAKPCILFFDEFDSLAPRRGHDSTGVTDRVVNQLLTQLDGVESLESGIFVMAASSRPDLIDPALLRPGRLDRKALCPMPNFQERLDILNALGREVHFESRSEDLRIIATKTDGFSGADLQAILYTARLESLKEKITRKRKEVRSAERMDGIDIDPLSPTSTPLMHLTYCESRESWQIQPSIRMNSSRSDPGIPCEGREEESKEADAKRQGNQEEPAKTIEGATSSDLFPSMDPRKLDEPAETHEDSKGTKGTADLNLEEKEKSISTDSRPHPFDPPAHNRDHVPITRDHLLAALKDTKPSVSIEERQKFERIYQRFSANGPRNLDASSVLPLTEIDAKRGTKDPNLDSRSLQTMAGSRATLK